MKSPINDFNGNHMVNTSANESNNMMRSASDYILVGMIIVMLLCMALCCLCLFCRSSSRFTFCGFNFEINDRNAPVAAEDLSELHEVVPLTPTTIGTYNIPDIESKLRGDPPPPKYVDAASSSNFSVLERFTRKSKHRANSKCNDKFVENSSLSSESSGVCSRVNKRRKDKQNRIYHSFQRSFSYQHPTSNSNAITSAKIDTSEEKKPTRSGGFFSSLRPSLRHSASDCTFNTRLMHNIEEGKILDASPESNPGSTYVEKYNQQHEVRLSLRDDVICEEAEQSCKESNTELYDDEVFL